MAPLAKLHLANTIYHIFTSAFKDLECFRLLYEPLFFEHGVDLVLSGHTHGYERTKSMVDWKVTANQETYLPKAHLCLTLQNGSYRPSSQPEWSAHRKQCVGTSLLTVLHTSHALWHMHCQGDPPDEYQDSFWLIHDERNGCSTDDFPFEHAVFVPSGGQVAASSS